LARTRVCTLADMLAGLALALALTGLPALAHAGPKAAPRRPAPIDATPDPYSAAKTVLLYLPNRLFDLTDVARMHVRLGPGYGAGARATRYMHFFLGTYKTTWFGMPGPRGRASIPLPLGFEGQTGVALGPVEAGGWSAPNYGAGEFGVGTQLYMIGFDFGFDPYELADFFAGFALVDLAHDDF
jgi:hypothetical protein